MPTFCLSCRQIKNVVASCRITPEGTTVELKDLAQAARNAEYNPKVSTAAHWNAPAPNSPIQLSRAPRLCLSRSQRFAAVIMRLIQPKSTALVFESGKMVVLGAQDENLVTPKPKTHASVQNMRPPRLFTRQTHAPNSRANLTRQPHAPTRGQCG